MSDNTVQSTVQDIFVQEYTPKSLVVRGNTKLYKEQLKQLGGKYNSRLKDVESSSGISPGWIFPKTKGDLINKFLETGEIAGEEEEQVQEASQPPPMREIKATPVRTTRNPPTNAQAVCPHCQDLRKEIAILNQKMDKILGFFDKSEQLRKNMMAGAGNMMKNIFGATAEMMNECASECYVDDIMEPLSRPPVGRIMRPPPSVTVLDEDNEDSPTAILLEE